MLEEREKPEEGSGFMEYLAVMLLILFVLWSVKAAETYFGISLAPYGLKPRTAEGLRGVFTMPFIHGDWPHLMANSFPLLLLGIGLFMHYERVAFRVLIGIVVTSGLFVWLMARPSYHIGASGVVYGLTSFLFCGGLLRRDKKSVGAALIVALLYGSTVWGLLPIKQGVSWEGHLGGAIAGALLAFRYRKHNLPPKSKEEEDPMDAYYAAILPWDQPHQEEDREE